MCSKLANLIKRTVILWTVLLVTAGAARADTLPGWVDWNGDFIGPCHGDCAISLYGGKEVTSSMERTFFVKLPATLPWDWNWRDTYLVAGAFSRRLVTFLDVISIEPEIGVGRRFGQMHTTELWGAFNLRWIWFPWNDYVRTSIGLADGLSFTSNIDPKEQQLTAPHIHANRLAYPKSYWMNFFTPELTLALPEHPQHELLFRFHHRSGVYGEFGGTFSGAQFFSAGFRYRF